MKKNFKLMLSLLVALFVVPLVTTAQEMPGLPQLPRDKDVRYGVLPNGLTYYIRHNERPKGQADFYIAQKVGSILEDDHQRGLAHFLEHMCFNGTENFPGNSLITWLESNGVKFGQNLNAYTSIDQTVYNISNVPVARESVQDSCLLILHDWADGLLLDPEEIDKERGVIHEEWRSRNIGQQRILEELLPRIYPGNKYGYRLPIGTMEVVDNFPHQALRDYYEKWYRPDQQGVIVVGDIDVDRIENKIKELFGPIKMPENVATREYLTVPDHEGTIVAVGHDPEQTNNIVQLSFLSDPMPREMKNTQAAYMESYMQSMISNMLNQRLADLGNEPDCPYVAAFCNFGNFLVSKTKDAFDVSGVAKTDDLMPTLETIYREVLRAARGGFTSTEYDRAKSQYLANLDKMYNNRASRENEGFVNEYVNNFLDNEAIPGIDTDYQLGQQVAQMIPLELINQAFSEMITDDNRVLIGFMAEKEGVTFPSDADYLALLKKVDGEDIEAFVDEVKTEPLIPSLPQPGKITKEQPNKQWGATEFTLSNGVKVIVKKTDFKEDDIRFLAIAKGGTSIFPDANASSLIFMPVALEGLGLGDYTNSDLKKYLQGKIVDIDLSFSDYMREVSGNTSPKDLPYLMELIYMAFTNPSLDTKEYEATQSQYAGYLANMASNPDYVFSIELKKALYNSPRMQQLTADVVKAADRNTILDMTRKMVANAADYTFIFVGNVDVEKLRPLLEQYIATLPADAKAAAKNKVQFIPATQIKGGRGIDTYSMEMQTPQITAFLQEWGNLKYTPKNRALASIVGQILSARLLKTVREENGAVYSIGAQGGMLRLSPQNTMVISSFPMDPSKKDLVLELIDTEFKGMANEVSAEELNKVKEFMIKNHGEAERVNESWVGWIGGSLMNGVDTYAGYVDMINSITPADVAQFMKELNKQGNYRIFMLEPAK